MEQEHREPIAEQRRIAEAISGDEQALQSLVSEQLPRVRNLVRHLSRGEDIDDLTHDALVTVMERLRTYRGDGRFESWVDGVCLRVVLRSLGRRRARQRREDVEHADELVAQQADSPTEVLVTQERTAVALEDLPSSQREALLMHYSLGMTIAEIAEALQTPAETVRSRLRVGMGRLRALLGTLREPGDA